MSKQLADRQLQTAARAFAGRTGIRLVGLTCTHPSGKPLDGGGGARVIGWKGLGSLLVARGAMTAEGRLTPKGERLQAQLIADREAATQRDLDARTGRQPREGDAREAHEEALSATEALAQAALDSLPREALLAAVGRLSDRTLVDMLGALLRDERRPARRVERPRGRGGRRRAAK